MIVENIFILEVLEFLLKEWGGGVWEEGWGHGKKRVDLISRSNRCNWRKNPPSPGCPIEDI